MRIMIRSLKHHILENFILLKCKGIGTEAIKQQLNICKQKDKKIAFLQTEDGFYPAELYRKIGFKDICNVYYYVKKN